MRQVMIATDNLPFAASLRGCIRFLSLVACWLLLANTSLAQSTQSDPGAQKPGSENAAPGDGGISAATPKPGTTVATAPQGGGDQAKAELAKPAASQATKTSKADAATALLKAQIAHEEAREKAAQIQKPLLEPNAIEKYDRVKFLSMMRSGIPTPADRKIFDASLRYRVLEMAEGGNFRKAGSLRVQLLRTLKSCGSKVLGGVAKKKFRQETMAKVVVHCESMLDNQLTVRLNAVLLIGQLDLEPGAANKKPVPYLESYKALLKIVQDPNQLPSIKLAAVRGLQRILKLGGVAIAVQDTIGNALVAIAVKGNPAFPWLDTAICETMAEVKTANNARLQGLLKIMADTKREFRVRSKVAYALGRTGWNPPDADKIASEVVELLKQICVEYNKNPRNTTLISDAYFCYLAYHRDAGANINVKTGLLARNPTVKVKESFEKLVVPTTNLLFNNPGRPLSPRLIEAQTKWLKANGPAK